MKQSIEGSAVRTAKIASTCHTAALKRNLWTADYKNSADTKVFLAGEQKRLTSLLTDLGLAK